MQKFILYLVSLISIVYITNSQTSERDSQPVSFLYTSLKMPIKKNSEIKSLRIPIPNIDSVLNEERRLDSLGVNRPYKFGISIPVNYNHKNIGLLETLEDGSMIWRLKVACPFAKSINFGFNNLILPLDAFLYTYSINQNSLDGPWSSENSRKGKFLYTFPVNGEVAVIEVWLPKGAYNEFNLEVEQIIYGFNNQSIPDISISPNPASDYFEVDGLNIDDTVELVNTLGDSFLKSIITEVPFRIQIDNTIPKGFYILMIQSNGNYTSRNVIIN